MNRALASDSPIRSRPRGSGRHDMPTTSTRCRTAAAIALLALAGCGQQAVQAPPTLDQAMEQLGRYRFDHARTDLTQVRGTATPGDETWRKATYGLAMAWQQDPSASKENTAAAIALHEELWQRSPGTPEALHAAMQLGRMAQLRDYYQDVPDLAAARGWYEKAIAAAGDDLIGSQCLIYLAGAWIEELTPEGFAIADRLLSERLAARPQDPLASMMWMTLADLRHVYRGDPRGAVQALAQVDRLGAPSALRWKVVWRMGSIAQDELKDRDLAVACFRAIATSYLRSGRADEARDRLRELGVEPPPLPANLWDVQGEPAPVQVVPLEAKP